MLSLSLKGHTLFVSVRERRPKYQIVKSVCVCARVSVCGVWRGVHFTPLYMWMCAQKVHVMYLDLSFLNTWSQLALNEVPDKHAAAATLVTIAHDPDTVDC